MQCYRQSKFYKQIGISLVGGKRLDLDFVLKDVIAELALSKG